ncbi:MAG: hypothetical protein ACYS8I_05840 [Planctomycetota bacterium]|jgi:hypothetical protein
MIFVDYPGHFIAGLLLVSLAVLIFLCYRSRELQKQKLKRYKFMLALLQYVSMVILLLILWNPSDLKEQEEVVRNSVLVFFDTSESMSVVEQGRQTRLDDAMKIFERKFRASGQEGPEYKIFGYDRQAYHSGSLDFLRRWGPQTNMHSVFALLGRYDAIEENGPAEATEDESPQAGDDSDEGESGKKGKVAGAVVFTDGQADDKNIAAYLAPSARDLPVVIVGIGSKDPRSDVAVGSAERRSGEIDRVTIAGND